MKKTILAAALLAPFAVAPAFAEDGNAGFVIDRPATAISAQPREFIGRDQVRTTSTDRVQIDRERVPSSSFSGAQ